MIYGIGTDIVAVTRMADMHIRYGTKLAEHLLAPEEWGDYARARDKDRFLAKRFAAKEALAKALGTGLRAPVGLAGMGLRHDGLGRPAFAFTPELQAWINARRITRVHVSLSDEQAYAVAFVVVEGVL
jgi:holo-[acyl-carrier protein] synthase